MTAPIQPQPSGPSLEGVLAQKANEAIQKGADPRAVTDRLGVMVQHLRDNPEVAQFGESALSKGADPSAVAGRVWSLASQAQQAKQARTMSDGSEATAGVVPSALDAATFGLSRKITAALPVMQAVGGQMLRHPFTDFSGTADPLYRKNLAAQDAATAQYHAQHPVMDTAASLAGGVGGVALTGGLGAVGDGATQVPRLARWGKLAGMGGVYGAANAAGHSTALDDGRGASGLAGDVAKGAGYGVAGAAASIPVLGAGGWILARTPLPRLASQAVGAVASRLPGAAGDVAATTADAINPQMGRAQQVIGQRYAADMQGGVPVPPTHPSLPPMALNTATPNVAGLAEGIANKPGPGRATILNALAQRQAAMRPAISAGFDKATGTTDASGTGLMRRLNATLENQRSVARVGDALTESAAGAKPSVQATPIDAFHAEIGGEAPNGVQALRTIREQQQADASHYYGLAKAETGGQPMQSPTLDAFHQTPVGKLAQSWAKQQMANRDIALPRVTSQEMPGIMQKMLDEAQLQDRAKLLEQFRNQGAVQDVEHEVADPQMLHYEKQYVAKLARLGVNDGAQGTLATQAQGALQQWNNLRNELPEGWRVADEVFAGHERAKDMLNTGRNILRTQANPVGKGNKQLFTSLDALEQKVASADPEHQALFRGGSQSAIADYLNGGGKIPVQQLTDPASLWSRRIVLATGDERAPARMAAKLTPNAQQIPAAPPVPELPAPTRAAQRGLGILQTTEAPSDPRKSLAVLAQDAQKMSPLERTSLQQGAAQAARGQWNAASGSLKSPGRVFDFVSPETSKQLAFAMKSPEAADDFQQAIAAWDNAQKQSDEIAGNSRTTFRKGEVGGSDLIHPGSLLGQPRRFLRGVINKLDSEYQAGAQQQVDAEIARILTSPDMQAIPNAAKAGVLRARLISSLQRGAGGSAALQASR